MNRAVPPSCRIEGEWEDADDNVDHMVGWDILGLDGEIARSRFLRRGFSRQNPEHSRGIPEVPQSIQAKRMSGFEQGYHLRPDLFSRSFGGSSFLCLSYARLWEVSNWSVGQSCSLLRRVNKSIFSFPTAPLCPFQFQGHQPLHKGRPMERCLDCLEETIQLGALL